MTATSPPSGSTYDHALRTAEELLGFRLQPFLEDSGSEPPNAGDLKRIFTEHAFADSWPRTQFLDVRTRALVSVTTTAVLGVHEPLRGQLRIALRNGVTPEEIVEAFIQIGVYAGVARAFDSYSIAAEVFAEASARDDTHPDTS
jgi:4-carboxymuconolactone decarboxylase